MSEDHLRGPSAHLTWTELACKDAHHTAYPHEWRDDRAVKLAALFETIRTLCGGKGITVLSAYRTFLHNKSIGGAPKSQHLQGRALDLRPPSGMTVEDFYKTIWNERKTGRLETLGGIGLYKTFVHVDVREVGKLVAWVGVGVKDDRG